MPRHRLRRYEPHGLFASFSSGTVLIKELPQHMRKFEQYKLRSSIPRALTGLAVLMLYCEDAHAEVVCGSLGPKVFGQSKAQAARDGKAWSTPSASAHRTSGLHHTFATDLTDVSYRISLLTCGVDTTGFLSTGRLTLRGAGCCGSGPSGPSPGLVSHFISYLHTD